MYTEVAVPRLGVVWTSAADSADAEIPADGSADLILIEDELLIAGPSTRSLRTRGSPGPVIGLRFEPGLIGAYLGGDPSDIRDLRVLARDIIDARSRSLAENAMRALLATGAASADASPAQRDEFLSLTGRLQGALEFEPDPRGIAAAHVIRAAASRGSSADDVADLLGCSTRQLRRRMAGSFGYGYAALRRVIRVERALRAIRSGTPLADAAAIAGFSDQPHLTREFRALAGAPPAQFSASGA